MRSFPIVIVLSLAGAARAAPVAEGVVPTGGAGRLDVSLPAAGRYAVRVESGPGLALRVVDRVSGPGAWQGRAGAADGRVDTLLAAGTYRVETDGPAYAEGEARVRVDAFRSVGEPAALPDGALREATLGDLQVRSFVVAVGPDATEPVVVEAMGRHLRDLRLWHPDGWLVDAQPTCTTRAPDAARPQQLCTLSASLSAGRWTLRAYGGPAAAWSTADDARPLVVRRGIPHIGAAGRRTVTISPFGLDRFVASETPTVRAAVDAPRDLRLGAAAWKPASPFPAPVWTALMTPKSRQPEVTLRLSGAGPKILTVEGAPGLEVVLDHFVPARPTQNLPGKGPTWVAVTQAADVADAPPPGVVVTQGSGRKATLIAAGALPIGPDAAYSASIDLRSARRVLVDVAVAGPYAVSAPGAHLVFEPFFVQPPSGYRRPMPVADALRVDLAAGLHVLTVTPREPQAVTLAIGPADRSAPRVVPAPDAHLPDLDLKAGSAYRVTVFGADDVPLGLVVRRRPLDLEEPMPLALAPGEAITVPLKPTKAGTVAVDGAARVRAGGGWARAVKVGAGVERVEVRNPGAAPVRTLLTWTPAPPAADDRPPAIVKLAPGETTFVDLARETPRRFEVGVGRGGAWLAETTGLLATAAAVHGRVRVGIARGLANGAGRNARVEAWLGEGRHLIEVTPQGASQGRAGVRVRPAPVIDGGVLRDGVVARSTVAADQAQTFAFTVDRPGAHRVRALGRGRALRCRVEDADGWPLEAPPVRACDRSVTLPAGAHRLVVLPEPLAGARLVQVEGPPAAPTFEGAGPHPLPLGRAVAHIWQGGEPHTWAFEMPAPGQVTVTLDDAMAGEVVQGEAVVARLSPGKPWTGELGQGPAALRVRAARPDDRRDYSLEVQPTALMAGLARRVRVGATVPVVVGEDGLYEVTTFGSIDVKATLTDAAGAVVGEADDQPDDWNPRLTVPLTPGDYTLHVTSVDGQGGAVEARLARPAPVEGPALAVGAREAVRPGDGRLFSALRAGDAAGVEVRADGGPAALRVEVEEKGGWRTVGAATGDPAAVAFRPAEGARYRAALRALNPARAELTLSVGALRPRAKLAGPATWRLAHTEGLRVCRGAGVGCVAWDDPLLPVGADGAWLLADADPRAERVRLKPGVLGGLPAAEAAVDLEAGRGPLVARVTGADVGVALDDGVAAGPVAVDASGVARRVRVWGAPRSRVRLEVRRLAAPEAAAVAFGVTDRAVAAGGGLELTLPGPAALALTLGPDLVARVGDLVVGGGDAPTRVDLRGARVQVFNPTGAPGRVTLEAVPAGPDAGPLQVGAPAEWRAVSAGLRPVRVPKAEGVLRLAGAARGGVYARADGARLAAEGAEVGAGGVLWVDHAAGWALTWIATPEAPGPWRGAAARAARIDGPARVALSGSDAGLSVKLDGPALVQVRAAAPFVARLTPAGGAPRVEVRPAGGVVDLWLPEGAGAIALRAPGGGALWGDAIVTTRQPTDVAEGLGPEVLLAPGDVRLFRVRVQREGAIGLGVADDGDRVEATLFDPAGQVVAAGAAAMPTLTPGDWLLALRLPPDAPPARARPALVGVKPPDTGPPPEVVQGFAETATATPEDDR